MDRISSLEDLCLRRRIFSAVHSPGLSPMSSEISHSSPQSFSPRLDCRSQSLHPPSRQIEADPALCTDIRAPVVTVYRYKTRWQVRNVYLSTELCLVLLFSFFFFPTAAEFFNVEHPLKPSLESDTVWPCQTKSRQRSLTRVQNIYR